jgi:uncharacterized cofD-like protein
MNQESRKLKVITIGGGGGHAALVSVLKNFPIELTALCNTVDDGGSSGILMRERGAHHPGEVRRILSVLANDKGKDLELRYIDGPNMGHTMGNLLLADLEQSLGSQQSAIDEIRKRNGIVHNVAPMTADNPVLHAKFQSGAEVAGQAAIVKQLWAHPDNPIEKIWVDPSGSTLSAIARQTLVDADYIIVAMGDLYSSIAPSFCLTELQELWSQIHAKVVWFPNLVAPIAHTHYKTTSRALEFLQLLFPAFQPDIIVTHSQTIENEVVKRLSSGGYMVSSLDLIPKAGQTLIQEDILSDVTPVQSSADLVARSPIQYDAQKIQHIFETILI